MSRAFTPPDTLSQDDIRTVADVRRAVWINGLFGLGAGSVTGMLGHLVLQTLQRRYIPEISVPKSTETTLKKSIDQQQPATLIYKLLKPLPPLTKNTFFLSFLGGGALGSFLLSSTAGKNAVHLLHPIFNLGRDEYAGMTPYQVQSEKLKREEEGLEIEQHKERKLNRKASIKERIESGNSLSDTHSTHGHYTAATNGNDGKEDGMHRKEVWERRQTERRKWVRDKIESGGSLSDSHVTSSSSSSFGGR